jgi:uncharacterized membrane protein YccC
MATPSRREHAGHEQQHLAPSEPASVGPFDRTAVAAVVSLVVARALELPEAYWDTITTLIIMQSTLGAALAVSE